MSHVCRWHHQLSASQNGPMVNGELLHFQQSHLDRACGHHSALMALMLFGYISRDEADGTKRRKKALATFWKKASTSYFSGCQPEKLASYFKPYQDQLSCNVVDKPTNQTIRDTLHADGLCIIGIQSPTVNHWTLAIGIGGPKDQPDDGKLLLLDPGLPVIPMCPWNATLTLKQSKGGWRLYETARGCERVRLTEAICLNNANS